jgi:hypothetical protein
MQEPKHDSIAETFQDNRHNADNRQGVSANSGLAGQHNGKSRSYRHRLHGFIRWLALFKGNRRTIPEGCDKDACGKLASTPASLSSAVLSNSQDVLGESKEICGDRSGAARETRTSTGRASIMPFLHLGVKFEDDEAPKRKAIEEVLNRAKDWLRYAPDCWLIYTTRDAKTWSTRLREIPGMEGHTSFLICEVSLFDSKASGWLAKSAWEWINKSRSE